MSNKLQKRIVFSLFSVLFLSLSVMTHVSQALTFDAAFTYGGNDYFDTVYGMAGDVAGNSYAVGRFMGSNVDFNDTGAGSPDLHSSPSDQNSFITKINPNGSYAYTYSLNAASSNALDVAVDASSNMYIVGWFVGSGVDFNSTGLGGADLKTSAAGGTVASAFLTKLNANGTYGYTYIIGGGNYFNQANSVSVDASGNVYIAGEFSGTNVDFNTTGSGSPDLKTSSGPQPDDYTDMFVTKYSTAGAYIFSRTAGGSDYDAVNGVDVDSTGNIYTTGYFRGTNVDFNTTGSGSPDLKTSSGYTNIFLTKYTPSGGYGYTYTMGGTEFQQNIGHAVAVNSNNDVYLAGAYWASAANFNTTGSGAPDIKNSGGDADSFITKINNDGTYGFTYTYGVASEARDIEIDIVDNVYVVGGFIGTNVNFNTTGTGLPVLLTSDSGSFDGYITSFLPDDSHNFTHRLGGNDYDFGEAVATDSLGRLFYGGTFGSSNVDFNTTGSGSPLLKSSNGFWDGFFVRYLDAFDLPDDLDNDGDGVGDVTEKSGPLGPDMNENNIRDNQEANIVSSLNTVSGSYMTTTADNCSDGFSSVFDYTESALPSQDSNYDYPFGLRGIVANCVLPGSTATISVYMDKVYDTSKWVYRKYLPSVGYINFSDQVIYDTTIVNGVQVTRVTFQITDGGQYDVDGIANGTIVDPAGPAILASATTQPELLQTGSFLMTRSLLGLGMIVSVILLWIRRFESWVKK
jgi:hypothetical protein